MTLKELDQKNNDIENTVKELMPIMRAILDAKTPQDYEKNPDLKERCQSNFFFLTGDACFTIGKLEFLFQDYIKQAKALVKQEQMRRRS